MFTVVGKVSAETKGNQSPYAEGGEQPKQQL